MKRLLVFSALFVLAGCGGGHSPKTRHVALIAVNAPFSQQSSLGTLIEHGAELAAAAINGNGGIAAGGTTTVFRVKVYDNNLSAVTAVANVRRAIADHAVAIVTDGTGVDASWETARKAGVPIGIVHDGQRASSIPRSAPTSSGSRRPTTGSRSASPSTSRTST